MTSLMQASGELVKGDEGFIFSRKIYFSLNAPAPGGTLLAESMRGELNRVKQNVLVVDVGYVSIRQVFAVNADVNEQAC